MFDINLMVCLLRNLTNSFNIQDSLPEANDTSESADLSRVKYYRNTLAHYSNAELSENDFNVYWDDISKVYGHALLIRTQHVFIAYIK